MRQSSLILLLLVVSVYCGPLHSRSKLLNFTTHVPDKSIHSNENFTPPVLGQLHGEADIETGLRVAQWKKESGINPEELGSYFQGDIVIPDNGKGSRSGLRNPRRRWPGGVVPYVIGPDFNEQQKKSIRAAMDDYHKYTCIKFVPYSGKEKDYIQIGAEKTGCWSSIGRIGGLQKVNIQVPGCNGKGSIIHELMHAIGFDHEQSRSDRDDFVEIHLENVEPRHRHNFDKNPDWQVTDFNVSYDYNSVMHYSALAFSRNGQPTIVPTRANVQIGQHEGFSEKDILSIRRMYKCDGKRTE